MLIKIMISRLHEKRCKVILIFSNMQVCAYFFIFLFAHMQYLLYLCSRNGIKWTTSEWSDHFLT